MSPYQSPYPQGDDIEVIISARIRAKNTGKVH